MPPLPGLKVLIGHGVRKSTTSDRAGTAQKATVRLSMQDRKTGMFFLEMSLNIRTCLTTILTWRW